MRASTWFRSQLAISALAVVCGFVARPVAAAPVAPGPFDAVARQLPVPVIARPRTTMMWEPAGGGPPLPGQGHSPILYLNCCAGPGCTAVPGNTNATTNPPHSSLGHGVLNPFSRGDAVWNTVVDCMKEVFEPFDVQLTEIDPGSAAHFEVMFGGMPQQLGLPDDLGGVSPFSCQSYIPNSLVFVFDVWGDDAEEICATAAQELAHSFAIDHAIEPSDPMTYFQYKGRRNF